MRSARGVQGQADGLASALQAAERRAAMLGEEVERIKVGVRGCW